MSITIKVLIEGRMPQKEYDYAVISDKLWELGTLAEIKKKVSEEVFNLHICINTIGIWKGDGWDSIFAEHSELLPYIFDAMNVIGLTQVSKAFAQVLATFPPNTYFNANVQYSDIINFLLNPRFKIDSEFLNAYSKEDRVQMSKRFNEAVASLDDITTPLWKCNAPNSAGWNKVLNYIQKHAV